MRELGVRGRSVNGPVSYITPHILYNHKSAAWEDRRAEHMRNITYMNVRNSEFTFQKWDNLDDP